MTFKILAKNILDIQYGICTLNKEKTMVFRLKKDAVSAFKNITSLAELEEISKRARQNITFFGHRYTKFDGYKGTVSIYKIHEKLIHILDNCPAVKDPDKIIEKSQVFAIKRIIEDLYMDNFDRKTNIITRIFCAIRDFFARCTASGYAAKSILNDALKNSRQPEMLHKRYPSLPIEGEPHVETPPPETNSASLP